MLTVIAYQIDASLKPFGVNLNLNDVSLYHLPDGTAGECLRSDMPDTRARGNPGKPGIGNQRDVLTEREMLERSSKLINFFHPCAKRSAATQHDNISRLNAVFVAAFKCLDSIYLSHKDARGSCHPIHSIGIDDTRVDRCAFNHRTFWREVAARERHGAG